MEKQKEKEKDIDEGNEKVPKGLRIRAAEYFRKILDPSDFMGVREEVEMNYNLNMALFRDTEGDPFLKDFLFLAGILKYPEDWSKTLSETDVVDILATSGRGGLRSEQAQIYLRGWKMLRLGRPASVVQAEGGESVISE